MILIKYTNYVDFEYDIQGLVRSFYPGADMVTDKEVDADIVITADFNDYSDTNESNIFTVMLSVKSEGVNGYKVIESKQFEAATELETYELIRKETKNRLKRTLYTILKNYTGKDLPWGTLSGIRPTKITSSYLESGMEEKEALRQFKETYYVSDIKAKESIEISKHELSILKDIDYQNGYSIYIGIPFCPSTCLYCSFTSNPVSKFKNEMETYIDSVIKELEFISKSFSHKVLNTIYIGGGTPTTLEASQMDRLLTKVESLFDTKKLLEFTVEAGRPDSITEDKLRVIKKHDVTRISINPQTMHDKTLKVIGRHHTVEQFVDAYKLARSMGFDNINMDFILGLPGEDEEDVKYSMKMVEELKPDSLTIHSLAIKRAARLNIFKDVYKDYNMTNNEEIMQITKQTAKNLDLKPYYLYRQKNMAGNLENIGYASDGRAGIYNILIMEEKQTIMAVGAGSSTKMVFPGAERIERIENVKDVKLYISRIDEMIQRKADFIMNNKCFRKD